MENRKKNWFHDGQFNELSFEQDKEKIIYFYQTKGYVNIKIVNTQIQYQWQNPTKKNIRELKITIYLEEGEKYYFGKIDIKGYSIFAKEEIQRFITRREGSIFNKQIHDQEIQNIYEIYRQRGYIFTRITPLEKNQYEQHYRSRIRYLRRR